MREELVEAALDQFHARGFNAAGVKDITDSAGVPKGSFYNHFESKEALAVVALQRFGESRRLEDLANESVPPLARLRAHFEFLRDETVQRGFARGCLVGNFGTEVSDHSETIRAAVQQSLQRWAELIAAVLAEAQRTGTVRAGLDPQATARFVLNAWEGTLIEARASRSMTAFDTFFGLVFGTLLTSDATGPTPRGTPRRGQGTAREALSTPIVPSPSQ
ncbi:TetR/AcrR family transcriptional regulator [Vitiosangium sp. GDMCC 1.1324]|uniref:TetR/AcrR family transcriptional regulator n=1 Tax=Vitiosangium sp. (strain GDMCC 1.1324) TaxID=2138576 RepID=UPI00130E2231|nr:TetR/AcrR family transcriptional regulator [Vitiosangium sp. GDMCC 1.1324]